MVQECVAAKRGIRVDGRADVLKNVIVQRIGEQR
jgi:hypothetical protein